MYIKRGVQPDPHPHRIYPLPPNRQAIVDAAAFIALLNDVLGPPIIKESNMNYQESIPGGDDDEDDWLFDDDDDDDDFENNDDLDDDLTEEELDDEEEDLFDLDDGEDFHSDSDRFPQDD